MIDPKFPLIDLHRHLDGSLHLETILDLGRKYNVALPAWTPEELRPHVQVTEPQPGVMAFISKFKWLTEVLVNPDACRQVAYENMRYAKAEGIDYLELRFSPWFMAERHQLDSDAVIEAVIEGVRLGSADTGVKVNLIGILSRTYGPDIAWKELESLLRYRDQICGLDLAGDEANYPGEWFVEHFKKAREAGWAITVHAGESAGAQSIWQAIDQLGAQRIGHGIQAVKDERLLKTLAERGIGIETNLTSNVQTSSVKDYLSHPLKEFLAAGILASINSDDPGISGIDLPYEYEVAAPKAGLTTKEILQAQHNALATAFLSEDERLVLLQHKTGRMRL